ncbi:MAG: hypothetical protein AB2786_03070, partial [Candidatus Thiodiazotropha endolucinida]
MGSLGNEVNTAMSFNINKVLILLLLSTHSMNKGADPNGAYLKPRTTVIPAQAGIQNALWRRYSWIPACAGMTKILKFVLSKYHSGLALF